MKPGRSLPNPVVAPAAEAPPPDLSGGGDIVDAQPGASAQRPGPQPKVIKETFANGGMAATADAKTLNERAFDARRSKVRALAVEKMGDIAINKVLPGSHTEEEAPPLGTAPAETAPRLDAATAAQIAERDRTVRELRKKIKSIETSTASDAGRLSKLKELAKTNPKGVAEYLGIPFQTYLEQVQKGDATPVAFEAAPDLPDNLSGNSEAEALRQELATLKAREQQRTTIDVVSKKVAEMKGDDGAPRYPRIARVGAEAKQEAIGLALAEVRKMRPLTSAEAHGVLEHFLDVTEAKYARAAGGETERQGRQAPQPRRPTVTTKGSPMDKTPGRDPSDPRNRPTSREIAANLRKRLIGS